jgi:hypothetical protein
MNDARRLRAIRLLHTAEHSMNFDIYLPEWLARYNKQIFGPLYAVGIAYLVIRAISWRLE